MIQNIRNKARVDSSVVKGIGDDCAVLKYSRDKYQLLTCDMLVEGVDFKPQEDPYLVGRKSLAVSLSDIAACAGYPHCALVSLGLPRNKPVKWVEDFFRGIIDLAREFKVNIVGGDLSRAPKVCINTTLEGFVEKKNLILRNGAETEDIIFVSGRLGGSISGRHLRFTPRIKEARFLAQRFKPTAMIDITDGLLQDLSHILIESNAGALLYEEMIPLSREAGSVKDAFYGGEDFELLWTLKPSQAEKLEKSGAKGFTAIGRITAKSGGLKVIGRNNKKYKPLIKGFSHF